MEQVDVRIGKVMLLSAVMGCLDPILTIAATMSSRSPFVSPFGKRAAADKAKRSCVAPPRDSKCRSLNIQQIFDRRE